MDFNEVMTERIDKMIEKKVNKEYREVKKCVDEFIMRHSSGYCKVWDCDVRKALVACLAENKDSFEIFPAMRDHLFRTEASKIMNAVNE